ncbi:MAG: hypothetical protein ACYSWU_11415, partial [Planctomycetota bacterium]
MADRPALPSGLSYGQHGAVQGTHTYDADLDWKFRRLENLSRIASAVAGARIEKKAAKYKKAMDEADKWMQGVKDGWATPDAAAAAIAATGIDKIDPMA